MTREQQEKRYLELQQLYEENLSFWEGDEFAVVENKYRQAKKEYSQLIENARKQSVKRIITKGEIYSVFPFEVEQHGEKLNGKVIPEVIMDNDCYIYHFDDKDRIILKENISEFLGKATYFSLYYYTDDTLEYIYGSSDIYRYQVFVLSKEGKVSSSMFYADGGKGYDNYYYEDGRIVRSDSHHIEFGKKPQWDAYYQYEYLYDAKGKLQQIFCIYPYGEKGIDYSTKRINYKKMEERIYEEMKAGVAQFLLEHKDETFTRFGLDCYSPESLVLSMDVSDKEDTLESLADWEYTEITEIALADVPMDDKQTEKLMGSITKALVRLVGADFFKPLLNAPNFKIVFLDHQGLAKSMYSNVEQNAKELTDYLI